MLRRLVWTPKGQKNMILRIWFIIFLWGFEPLCPVHSNVTNRLWMTSLPTRGPMRGYYPYEIEQRKGSCFPILGYVVVRKQGLEFFKRFGLFRKLRLKNQHPLKQTKTKNKHHFFIPTFKVVQFCFFAQDDSFTLKVLKTQFVFGLAMIRKITY